MANHPDAATLDATETLAFGDADVTGMVRALQSGERAHADRLLPVLYDELRRLARTHLRRERREHTLNATSLVHEAYLRARISVGLAAVLAQSGRGHEAETMYQRILTTFHGRSDVGAHEVQDVHKRLATLYQDQGQPVRARRHTQLAQATIQ